MNTTMENTLMDKLMNYISDIQFGYPILLKDVAHKFHNDEEDYQKTRNTISKYLNRLVQKGVLRKFDDGVFFKSTNTPFGEIPINSGALLDKLYINDEAENKNIGYRVGANVLSDIGISNNIENKVTIVTNKYLAKKILDKISFNVELVKPVTAITQDNHLYLQLLDTVKNIHQYHLTNEDIGNKLVNYMEARGIIANVLFKYADQYYSRKTTENLVTLLAS